MTLIRNLLMKFPSPFIIILLASLAVLYRVRLFNAFVQNGTNTTVKSALVDSISFKEIVSKGPPPDDEASVEGETPANQFGRKNMTGRDVSANLIALDDDDVVSKTRPPAPADGAPGEPPTKKIDPGRFDHLDAANISVYLLDTPGLSLRSLDYRFLAFVWDRNTTYEEILLHAANGDGASSSTSAKDDLRRKLWGRNVTVLFHTSPKTGSSTLRSACLETQYDSCGLPRKPEKMKWPAGYRNPFSLTRLFGQCPETRHFCAKEIPLVRNFTLYYDSRTFLHLFPFRNYDDWSASALHQIAYRDGEKGCRASGELLGQCKPHRFELNFERYTKAILANFISSLKKVIKRYNGKRRGRVEIHHHILLYNYLYLDETLTWLHGNYMVPLLSGTARKINSVRPEESCKDEEGLLKKFHDCFSGDLAGLH